MSVLNPYSGPVAAKPPSIGVRAALQWLASSPGMLAARRWIAALVARRQARLASDELRGWDDHMLRDIGLQRMDIDAAVRGHVPPLARATEAGRTRPRPDC